MLEFRGAHKKNVPGDNDHVVGRSQALIEASGKRAENLFQVVNDWLLHRPDQLPSISLSVSTHLISSPVRIKNR